MFRYAFLLLSIFLISDTKSADYKGKNIDNILYNCLAYSYLNEIQYWVNCEFTDDTVTMYFTRSNSILNLETEVITDINYVNAYDFKSKKYWRLTVDLEVNDD